METRTDSFRVPFKNMFRAGKKLDFKRLLIFFRLDYYGGVCVYVFFFAEGKSYSMFTNSDTVIFSFF